MVIKEAWQVNGLNFKQALGLKKFSGYAAKIISIPGCTQAPIPIVCG